MRRRSTAQLQEPKLTTFITGVSSGIGLGLANQLLAKGEPVVGVSRRPPPLDDPLFRYEPLDVSDAAAVELFEQCDSVDEVQA